MMPQDKSCWSPPPNLSPSTWHGLNSSSVLLKQVIWGFHLGYLVVRSGRISLPPNVSILEAEIHARFLISINTFKFSFDLSLWRQNIRNGANARGLL